MDLFETLQIALQCNYISDLRTPAYSRHAKAEMTRLNLREYPLHEISDMAGYLYGEPHSFSSYEQAEQYFNRKNKKPQS